MRRTIFNTAYTNTTMSMLVTYRNTQILTICNNILLNSLFESLPCWEPYSYNPVKLLPICLVIYKLEHQ
ncbi:hypothetical protein Hanom_Chr03g00231591 [Helianthus anomalus]